MKTASVFLLAILSFGCGGYSSPKIAPAQAGFVPVIAAIMPNTANHGDPAFTLTVNGNTFNTNAVVNWNGVAQTNTTHPAMNQLTVAIPASAIATAGSVAEHENATSDGNRVRNRLPQEKHKPEETPLRENASSNRVFQHQLAMTPTIVGECWPHLIPGTLRKHRRKLRFERIAGLFAF